DDADRHLPTRKSGRLASHRRGADPSVRSGMGTPGFVAAGRLRQVRAGRVCRMRAHSRRRRTQRLRGAVHHGFAVSPLLRVKSPGLHTTVQDLGRDGFADVGVPPSGALDAVALRLANALVGNAPNAPALEVLVSGPTLEVVADSA